MLVGEEGNGKSPLWVLNKTLQSWLDGSTFPGTK